MFDVKALRDDPAAFDAAWARRGLAPQTPAIRDADKALREAQGAVQAAQARRNEASKLIGAAKAKKDDARAGELMAEVEGLKTELPRLTEAEKAAETALRDILAALPNLPADDVPDGKDEHDNEIVHYSGQPTLSSGPLPVIPDSGADPGPSSADPSERLGPGSDAARPSGMTGWVKDHVALGEALGMMDFEAAARMSGARFVVLKKGLARLERALGQFMLDLQTREHGYEEVSPPLLVRDHALFGTGQLPKFETDLFFATTFISEKTQNTIGAGLYIKSEPGIDARQEDGGLNIALRVDNGDFVERERYLIPTAEVSLTNLVREQITPEDELPLRYTALTPCFRSEAGASGRDTRGMIRQHQFTKCELVSVTAPEQSEAEHERMVECAEAVLKRLGLPFRTMLLCAGDMGFSARKTYDLEVWLPSQGTYREISSCSNCGDFQARRMDARIKKAGDKGTRFPHTLNGSGLAVGRTLVAVMENYQDEAGRIAIPEALQDYMGGMTHIGGGA